jgi:fucose permease
LPAARRAVAAVFAANGFAFGAWASRIPALRDELRLTPDRLGLVLMALSVGSVLALPVSGLVVQRLGPAGTLRAVGLPACLGVVAIGVSPGVPGVVAGFFVWGVGTSLWDVAMNVEAAEVERRVGRQIMARFHAGWSLGSVTGAGLGALAARLDLSLRVHLPVAAALAAAVVIRAPGRFLPAPAPEAGRSASGRSRRTAALRVWAEPRTLALGGLVLGLTLAEGGTNDWFALGLVDGYGASQAVAALGYACSVAALLAGRVAAPAVLERLGRVTALRLSAVTAAAGLGLYVLGARVDGVPAGVLAVASAVLLGAGSALVFPVGLSAAADDPAVAAQRVAAVATIGYLAFLAGPPLLGRLAAGIGVVDALGLVALPVLLTVLLAGAARPPAAEPPAAEPTRRPGEAAG